MNTTSKMTTKQAYMVLFTGILIGGGLVYLSMLQLKEQIKNQNN